MLPQKRVDRRSEEFESAALKNPLKTSRRRDSFDTSSSVRMFASDLKVAFLNASNKNRRPLNRPPRESTTCCFSIDNGTLWPLKLTKVNDFSTNPRQGRTSAHRSWSRLRNPQRQSDPPRQHPRSHRHCLC